MPPVRAVPVRAASLLALALVALAPPALAGTPLVASCPADVVVECDGAGNVADRQAWIDAFTGLDGCSPLVSTLEVIPGLVIGDITYDRFCDVSALTLNGATAAVGHPIVSSGRCVLRLTNGLAQSGSAFVTSPVSLASDASFSTYFAFRIHQPVGMFDTDGVQGADGLVFTVQTVDDTAGGSGGGIGYQGLPDSVGVEFDTWDNGPWDDFNGNHVGIDLEGNIDSIVQAPVAVPMNDGNVWYAWVDYDGASDVLEVRLDTVFSRPALPLLSLAVDLPAVLGTNDAYVGFTSGTGGAGGTHDILEWIFNNSYDPVGCGATGAETGNFRVSDACGDAATCRSTFTIVDTVPPAVNVGPLPACQPSLAAAEAAALAAATAEDECAPAPRLELAGSEVSGCEALVTLRATDECGNAAEHVVTAFLDGGAPILDAPPDATVDCASVPPLAAIPVTDDCDPAPAQTMGETRIDGACPGQYQLIRTWTAVDRCGGTASATQVITVTDTTPPILSPGPDVLACAWPPNHSYACFGRSEFAPVAVDDCSGPVTWRFAGCASDQPDDGLGDGHFTEDCVASADEICVRSERMGMRAEGRTYSVLAVATDACGNESAPMPIGAIHVPHDMSPKLDCRRPGRTR